MSAPARGGMILVVRLAAMTALNYGFAIALVWLLTPTEFGQVAVLQAILWLGSMILNSGFPWTLAAAVADRERLGRDAVDRVFRTSLIGNLTFGLLLALLVVSLNALGAFSFGSNFEAVVPTAAITLPFFALISVARGALQGATRFGPLAVVQVGEVLVKCVFALTLVALFGMGIEAVALGFLAGAAAATVAAAWFLRDALPGRGARAGLETYARTLPMFVGAVGFALLLTVDLLTLRTLGAAAGVTAAIVALYQAGAMLARSPYFVGDALMDAVFPYIARRHDSAVHSHGYFMAAVRWIAFAILPLELILIVSPGPLLGLFFPATYGAAETIVRLLAVGSVGALAADLFGKALQALGRRSAAAGGAVSSCIIELSLLAVLVPAFGATGAATGFAVGAWAGAVVLALKYYGYQRVPLPPARLVARYGLALSLLLLFCLPAAGADRSLAFALLSVGFAGYGAALVKFDLIGVTELRRFATIAGDLLVLPRGSKP